MLETAKTFITSFNQSMDNTGSQKKKKSKRTKYSNIIKKNGRFFFSSSFVLILSYETYEMLLTINRRIYKRSHRELGCLWMHIHFSFVKSKKKVHFKWHQQKVVWFFRRSFGFFSMPRVPGLVPSVCLCVWIRWQKLFFQGSKPM